MPRALRGKTGTLGAQMQLASIRALAVLLLIALVPSIALGQTYFRDPKLVGQWSYKGSEGGSNLKMSSDGTWSATVFYTTGQSDDKFEGKWMRDDKFVYWMYTSSSSPKVKVGGRDKDRVIEVGQDHFEIETSTNRRHTYFRVK